MSMPHSKVLVFTTALAAVFGLAALAGAAIGPEPSDEAAGHGGASELHGGGHAAQPDPVRGLAVAGDGLRVVVETPELRRGREQTLRFRIADADGETVRDFDVVHERRLHLILARRDLAGFQHLHPRQAADGSWSTRVRIEAAGSYRLFADFSHDGEAQTLASDLRVDGPADLRPLPDPQPTAVADGGYEVRLDAGAARPGREADLRFAITRGGEPVDTEPYLGAGGHLVALREADMAFLHVHPTGENAVRFAATFPTAGRYRLFLQFKHDGRVRTAAFTLEVR
jgi:hypothetical protein